MRVDSAIFATLARLPKLWAQHPDSSGVSMPVCMQFTLHRRHYLSDLSKKSVLIASRDEFDHACLDCRSGALLAARPILALDANSQSHSSNEGHQSRSKKDLPGKDVESPLAGSEKAALATFGLSRDGLSPAVTRESRG